VLATIVKHFRFQLKPGHAVWPALRVTLRPANGLPMIVSARSFREEFPGEESHELTSRKMMNS